jgi:hypothetical protein
MNIESALRTLAKSNYWQSLYNAAEKLGVQLFENDKNFSGLQVRFLYWLSIYSKLYEELSTHEDTLLTEKVIDSEFRTDCYLTYRSKKFDAQWKKYRQDERAAELKGRNKKALSKEGKHQVIDVDLRRE